MGLERFVADFGLAFTPFREGATGLFGGAQKRR